MTIEVIKANYGDERHARDLSGLLDSYNRAHAKILVEHPYDELIKKYY